jgi:predicted enzyme related to lactoylglutathione lyase
MAIGISQVALAVDSSDPGNLARFWQALIGGTVSTDADGDTTLSAPTLDLIFIRVPETKQGKNRLHLDVRATDYEAAVAEAQRLGAVMANDVYDGDRWQVLRDPEGNEFCILRPRPL